MPKPANWSDIDEIAFRNQVQALAMRERDPYALGTQAEMQQMAWDNREADARFGHGYSEKMDKEIDQSQINAIISEILKSTRR